MNRLVAVLFLVGLLNLSSIPEVKAACCPADHLGLCGDGTLSTPYCGYGPCNVFGCNCDGGCRRRGREDVLGTPTENGGVGRVLETLDVNRDGKVDMGEMSAWRDSLHPESPILEKNITEEFVRMDMDRSGFLSANEIDEN